MLKRAVDKIEAEMKDKKANAYAKAVGQLLLQHIIKNPSAAEKILAEDKSIIKSLEEMQKVAAKKKVGGVAVLSYEEGFEIVLQYYGLGPDNMPVHPSQAAAQQRSLFDVKIEDLL